MGGLIKVALYIKMQSMQSNKHVIINIMDNSMCCGNISSNEASTNT